MDFQYIWYVCFVKENSKLEIFTVSLVILYVPLFILFRLLHTFLQNVIKGVCNMWQVVKEM